MTPEQKKESFVKRARVSANAGPYLMAAGAVFTIIGLILSPLHIGIMIVMAIAAVILQYPRQQAWRTQNDILEFISLGAMPLLLIILAMVWLSPAGALSWGTILQGLGGFFLAVGLFHIATKQHTLALADEIERSS